MDLPPVLERGMNADPSAGDVTTGMQSCWLCGGWSETEIKCIVHRPGDRAKQAAAKEAAAKMANKAAATIAKITDGSAQVGIPNPSPIGPTPQTALRTLRPSPHTVPHCATLCPAPPSAHASPSERSRCEECPRSAAGADPGG